MNDDGYLHRALSAALRVASTEEAVAAEIGAKPIVMFVLTVDDFRK